MRCLKILEAKLRSSVKKLWKKLWSGGLTNPLIAIEQMSYLIFMRRLESLDTIHKNRATIRGEKYTSVFQDHDDCRWSYWKNFTGDELLGHVNDTVFPFIKNLSNGDDTLYSKYMKGATFMIEKSSLLQEAISILDDINIAAQNQDTQGDIYEFLLDELQISGKNGQFRTPRHIIRMIIELIDPQLGETICDPACGTGGFLINSYEHIVKTHTSKDIIQYDEDDAAYNLVGDKITKKEHWNLLKNNTFFGYDIDYTMLRTGVMNMMLHGIQKPNINYADALSKDFDQKKQFDVILANPPFAGSIDSGDVHDNFDAETGITALLFCELFYHLLKPGGRAGVIVPHGVLSTNTKAHRTVRKLLLDKCQLDAVITMPSGVFSPYSGVATGILIFSKCGSTKDGCTKDVWFYDMQKDGYTLDDKRKRIDGKGDIPKILEGIKLRKTSKNSILVNVDEIKENNYELIPTTYTDAPKLKKSTENTEELVTQLIENQKEILKKLKKFKMLNEKSSSD